ncbi:hypothetical protein [Rhizobium sp. YTU87027]|uniref:hypothetical protein n=1 Tax=Rhizobium sp. YTU87027 TaxID=3417741 RepID=UPI003D69E72E
MDSSDHKFRYRIVVPLCGALLVVLGFLFGNSIVAFVADEGTILGELRLMRAQASVAVWDHYVDERAGSEADRH